MSPALDYPQLLQRHNPVLVIYPHDPKRLRPGARRLLGAQRWGDYHPCSAEFFLDRVVQRDGPKPYLSGLRDLFRQDNTPTGCGVIEGKVRDELASGTIAETRNWELDLARIPSQSEKRAWARYAELLTEPRRRYECVVYARGCEGPAGTALQYWYLYVYNDFWNNHEADWEMVTVHLNPSGSAERVAVSCHHGGYRLPWPDAPRDGERPIVRVARGSHGGYFRYRIGGFDPIDLVRSVHLPGALSFLEPVLKAIPPLPGLRDHAPADPHWPDDAQAPDANRGVRIVPELRILPPQAPPPNSADWPRFWWLNYEGRWGSWHSRISGTVGVTSPWHPERQEDTRWTDPVRWIDEHTQ
jgi:hypothetical protein